MEVRRSTGGSGLHLRTYLDSIPCENHTVHAALARAILGMMSSECNFDFASQIDCCGGVMCDDIPLPPLPPEPPLPPLPQLLA